MFKTFYSKHFKILFYFFYKNSNIRIFIKKIFLFYSYYRIFLKRKIKFIFNIFKNKLYGYKLFFFLNSSLNFNRYYKLSNNKFFVFYEIIFIFNKVFLFIK